MAQQNGTNLTIPQPSSTTTDNASSSSSSKPLSLATKAIHADDPMNSYTDVAPALHVSSTFRYPRDPSKLRPEQEEAASMADLFPIGGPIMGEAHIYSRLTAPNASRLEMLLSEILNAPCLTYSSGLSAFLAMLVWLKPSVVAIGDGYHGCHGVLKVYQKLTGCKIVGLFEQEAWDSAGLGEGDVVHLETPLNPTGKAFEIARFAEAAHRRGALLTVDATFAPPPLQDPFAWGADFVMHSGTKYFGGHSDMLCGVLAVGRQGREERWERDYWGLFGERVFLGSVMGSLEGWLGVRSLRTFELRVKRQSENADKLVSLLAGCLEGKEQTDDDAKTAAVRKVLGRIEHASLQVEEMAWLRKQMPNGFGPVFSIWARSESLAKRLPSKLHLFHHATSLGGVESLIEWRRMSDEGVEPTLLRVSVGVEACEDLWDDLVQGCVALADEDKL